jgi:hypothetical protein
MWPHQKQLSVTKLAEVARGFLEGSAQDCDDFTVIVHDDFLSRLGTSNGGKEWDNWWYEYCYSQSHGGRLPERHNPKQMREKAFAFQEEVWERPARLQVCRAFGGCAWSISVRWPHPQGETLNSSIDNAFATRAMDLLTNKQSCKWLPNGGYGFDDAAAGPFLFSIRETVDVLSRLVFASDLEDPGKGLVLVTGSTNCAKSHVARGLVWKRLQLKLEGETLSRRPHLITFEDPIESWFYRNEAILGGPKKTVVAPSSPLPVTPETLKAELKNVPVIDYTPRQAGVDTPCLADALKDALRQSPSAVYVGEIRGGADMRRCLEFAGTGHLLVATAHAGSLLESVGKILESVGADNHGKRAVFVPKILAVIHLSSLIVDTPDRWHRQPLRPAIPAMYRRTALGRQSLIGDGLAGILPFYTEQQEPRFGTLGRQFFSQRLLECPFDEKRPNAKTNKGLKREELRMAIKGWCIVKQIRSMPAAPVSGKKAQNSLRMLSLKEDLHGG